MNKIGTNQKRRRVVSFGYTAGFVSLVFIVALSLTGGVASARPLLAASAPGLGAAGSFAVLAASAVTNTGPTIVGGDLGINPNGPSSITGFPPGLVIGTLHAADGVSLQAQNDLTTAYNALASETCDTTFSGPTDLGGKTLAPGVYCFGSSAQLTGKLTLNGSPTDVWLFKIGSSLTTAPGSSVVFTNPQSCNVFWQVTSSATIDTTSSFVGNIIAFSSITINTSASLSGRALARNGAVTLDTNSITIPVCALPVPTNTPLPPATATAIALTATSTSTLPPTATATLTPTPLPGTQTAIPPTLTAIASTQTAIAPTIAPTLTAIAATQTLIAATQTVVIAPTLTAIVATQTALAPTATRTPTATPRPTATATPRPTATAVSQSLPATGFKPGIITILSRQPAGKAYASLGDLWLEIPRLGVQTSIVGVPQTGGEWDVSWLGQDAGWLNGSAFPTWDGNSVITGHVWNADNTPGPFYGLNTLWWGDKILVHAWGGQYVYEVRSVQQVSPGNTAAMLKHEELPWVTLVTCRGYDAASNSYAYRVLVRAVLVETE